MKLRYFHLLLPLLLLSGCLNDPKSGTEINQAAVPENPKPIDLRQKEITIDTTKMTDFAIDQNLGEHYFVTGLNKHLVYFKLPPEFQSGVQFYRWHHNTNTYELNEIKQYHADSLAVAYSEVLDLTGLPLEVQKYTYEVHNENGLLKKFDIEFKPDLKIRGEVHVTTLNNRGQNIDVDTIYIYKGSALITDGLNMRIDAKTVLSRGGIYTDSALQQDYHFGGTIGANLDITINRLIGTLNIAVGGPSPTGENNLTVHINELSRFSSEEDCGISTRVVAASKDPEVLIGRDRCTGQ